MLSADSLRLPSACPSDLPSAAFPSSLLRRLPLPAFTRSITLPHALAYNRLYTVCYFQKNLMDKGANKITSPCTEKIHFYVHKEGLLEVLTLFPPKFVIECVHLICKGDLLAIPCGE